MNFTIKWKSFALRYTSAALCISLLTGMFGGLDIRAVSPAPSAQIGATGNEGWTPSKQLGVQGRHEGDLSLAALPYAQLSDQDVPECVGTAQAEEKDHVKRLYKQETDLNTVIFQNRDGSKTMYYYNIPVKYVDEKGGVRDKSNALEVPTSRALTEYGFENKANDVKTYFPQKLDTGSGVLLEHTDIRIEMAPERAVRYAKINDNLEQKKGRLPQDLLTVGMDAADNGLAPGLQRKVNLDAVPAPGVKQIIADEEASAEMVAYDDVFGDGTTLRYAPTYTGFKEDIVLDSYTGMHEFSFIVKTHGLALVPHETSAYFVDPLTGEQKAWLGEILVHDSAGAFSDSSSYSHQYKIEKIRQDEEYRVTLIVDPAYLRAPERVYPVTIDPSITINFRGIQDATIYSNYQSSEGLSGSIFVGNYSSRYGGSKGVARTLVQFPGFLDNSTYVSLWSNQIQNVTYYIRDLMCESDTVQIDYYRATKHWEERDVKCSCEMWYAYKDYLGSINVGYNKGVSSPGGSGSGQWYGLDLTDIAKEWKKGTTDRYGIMMRAENELRGARTFASADRGSNLPVVIVEYNENTIPVSQVCVSSRFKTLSVGETSVLSATVVPSTATNKLLYYSTSDPKIVSVSSSGYLCAKDAGSAVITVRSASDGSKLDQCHVLVERDPIPLSPSLADQIGGPPRYFPDGTPITNENKTDYHDGVKYTKIYFQKYVWPLRVATWDALNVPQGMRTYEDPCYQAWVTATYGKNWLQKFWSCAEAFLFGVSDAAASTVEGTWLLITDPASIVEGMDFLLKGIIENGPERQQLSQLLSNAIDQCWADFTGSPESRSRLIGRVVGEILIGIAATKGITKALDALEDTKTFQYLAKGLSSGSTSADDMLIALGNAIDTSEDTVNFINKMKARSYELRSVFSRKKWQNGGNMALAEVNLPGVSNEFKAFSKVSDYSSECAELGYSLYRNSGDRYFRKLRIAGRDANFDSEAKILEDIAHKLGDNRNAVGNITLYTELAPCPSCQYVINQFRERYPNINLTVYDNNFHIYTEPFVVPTDKYELIW